MAALGLKQVSVTTGAQSLTTLLGLSAGQRFNSCDFIVLTGSETVYGGPSTVTNVPANAGFKFTATLPYSLPNSMGFQGWHTDKIFLVGTGACTALLTFLD